MSTWFSSLSTSISSTTSKLIGRASTALNSLPSVSTIASSLNLDMGDEMSLTCVRKLSIDTPIFTLFTHPDLITDFEITDAIKFLEKEHPDGVLFINLSRRSIDAENVVNIEARGHVSLPIFVFISVLRTMDKFLQKPPRRSRTSSSSSISSSNNDSKEEEIPKENEKAVVLCSRDNVQRGYQAAAAYIYLHSDNIKRTRTILDILKEMDIDFGLFSPSHLRYLTYIDRIRNNEVKQSYSMKLRNIQIHNPPEFTSVEVGEDGEKGEKERINHFVPYVDIIHKGRVIWRNSEDNDFREYPKGETFVLFEFSPEIELEGDFMVRIKQKNNESLEGETKKGKSLDNWVRFMLHPAFVALDAVYESEEDKCQGNYTLGLEDLDCLNDIENKKSLKIVLSFDRVECREKQKVLDWSHMLSCIKSGHSEESNKVDEEIDSILKELEMEEVDNDV